MSTIKVKVNGKLVEAKVEGAHAVVGSGAGHFAPECHERGLFHRIVRRACTVLMDGNAVCSCLVLAEQCDEAEITTLEGLNDNPLTQNCSGHLSSMAVCSAVLYSGVLVSTTALLTKAPHRRMNS